MQKLLIFTGVLLVIIGFAWEFLAKVPFFGRLPGDIVVHKKNFSFYFPLATSIILSMVLSLIAWFFSKHQP